MPQIYSHLMPTFKLKHVQLAIIVMILVVRVIRSMQVVIVVEGISSCIAAKEGN